MTETIHSTECSVSGVTLMLAFELGSTKWVLGFTTAPAQRPRIRTMAAGDLPGLEKEILLAHGLLLQSRASTSRRDERMTQAPVGLILSAARTVSAAQGE